MKQYIVIKHMVCPRCIEAVSQIFNDLEIQIIHIQLGKVATNAKISAHQKRDLQKQLTQKGFELLNDKHAQLINNIKSLIVQKIHHQTEALMVNFSTLLSEQLHYDYAYLSRLFSSVEGRTIEKFIIVQKIEKVKELLSYQEMTLSEIAFQMNYSSASHLSNQFKKITGMSPTEFKKLQKQDRHFINEI